MAGRQSDRDTSTPKPEEFTNRPAMKRNKPDMGSRAISDATQTPETGDKGRGKPAMLP